MRGQKWDGAPALTEGEWENRSASRDAVGFETYVHRHANRQELLVVGDTNLATGGSASFGDELFHPVAALCLKDQPFGFTSEGLEALEGILAAIFTKTKVTQEEFDLARAEVRKVAALLPRGASK